MEKLEITISPEDWGSLVTKFSPQKISIAEFSDGTINLDTDANGSITKRKGGPNYNTALLAASPKDQFEAIFSDGARHLLVVQSGEIKYSSGDTIFNTVVNGTGFGAGSNFEFATTQDRVYGGNATNSPIVYDRATSYGGVTYTAPRVRTMGAQAPLTAATATVAAGGAVPIGSHTYKVTYLYYDFEESNGSAASNIATTSAGNQTVNLTAVPIGGYGVTARKIYRDNNDGLWLHVGTITNNTATTFSDTVAVGVTPTEIPEFNNAPPVFGSVTLWLDKLWVAKVPGDPSTMFYSESGQPDIFRPENQILCNQEDPITAHIVYFDRLIVFNRRSMGQILGKTSDTFRYAAIPSSVGCVDNRTLQIRTIEGVPILLWLSDRGFYTYDGNSVNYISEGIEDLVNFNIQQALQQKNSNSQTTQTQFASGTSSQGIDLISSPGSITTKGYTEGTPVVGTNPRRNFDDQTDWDSAGTKDTCKIYDGSNQLKMPLFVGWSPTQGVHNGTITSVEGDGTHIKLPTVTTLSSESTGNGTNVGSVTLQAVAMKFVPTQSGTVSTAQVSGLSSGSHTYRVYSHDSGNDRPNVSLGNLGSIVVTAGVTYWLVMDSPLTFSQNLLNVNGCFGTVSAISGNKAMRKSGGFWFSVSGSPTSTAGYGNSFYSVTTAPTSLTGQWTSIVADTFSPTPFTLTYFLKGSYPSGTSAQLFVEGSNDAAFATAEVSQMFSNPNSSFSVTLSGKRYWRSRLVLTTTNNIRVPSLGGTVSANTSSFVLEFQRTATWISPAIDCTADVTAYNSLTNVFQNFGGGTTTTVTFTIATSADNLSYTAFVAFGSHVVQRYVKIRIVMTAGQAGGAVPIYFILSPTVTSTILRWTVVANLVSSGIDTAVTPPAGWDLFLAGFTLNGGSLQFQMRSATTLGGLTAATFFNVNPSEFPTSVTPLQFVQWKVIITSSDNAVPLVDSVTIQWFIQNVASIRPASIFVDSRYYVSLAEVNQVTNTILLEFDLNGKWRRHSGLAISTFSFFFNRPYFGLATSGQIRKFLEGSTDAGAIITLDWRTKAEDYSDRYHDNSSKFKVVGEVILQGTGTGAAFQVFYSVDAGLNFYPLFLNDGTTTYTSTADDVDFFVRFRPNWDNGNPITGRTIMYRILNSDINEVDLTGLQAVAFLRQQSTVVTG